MQHGDFNLATTRRYTTMLTAPGALALLALLACVYYGMRHCFAVIAARQRAVLRDSHEGLPSRRIVMDGFHFMRRGKPGSPKAEEVVSLLVAP